jgi:hypothetical protein
MPVPHGDPSTWTEAEREREQQRLRAYDHLIRAHDVSTRVAPLLKEFAYSAPQHETHAEALNRIAQYARRWLVRLEAEFEREQNATEREKFLNGRADYDPFVAGANLTRDSFAGQIPPEPETRPNER